MIRHFEKCKNKLPKHFYKDKQYRVANQQIQTKSIKMQEQRKYFAKKKVQAENKHTIRSKTKLEQYGMEEAEDIISFEHINVNGIQRQNKFFELNNILTNLQRIDAGIYSINKHNLDTTKCSLMKSFWETAKKVDKHAKIAISSNLDEEL